MDKIKYHKVFIMMATLGISFILCCLFVVVNAEDNKEECFYNSLHHTGEGMRYWYEENDGFMGITGIPYKELDCSNCHVKSCAPCHMSKDEDICSYSLKVAKDKATCLKCHSREKVTFALNEKMGNLDLHIANGMVCADCHTAQDVHGDGKAYKTMRDEGAVKTKCTKCHEFDEDDLSRSHKVHKEKLDCTACHVANTTTCLNCHFTKFLETGTRKGNFFPPIQEWVILVNYKGKITSGNVQTLVHEGKTFITYAPYFTHAVQKDGRKCVDCHANEAINLIIEGKSVPMSVYDEGDIVSWKGVVPFVPDKLDWVFLDKEGDSWIPIQDDIKPLVQYSCYAEPLTKDQITKMGMPFKK